jgi:hypothetical protein
MRKIFHPGEDFILTIGVYKPDYQTLEEHASIINLKAFLKVGSTQVAQWAKVTAPDFLPLEPDTIEGEYTLKVNGSDTASWSKNRSFTLEVHKFYMLDQERKEIFLFESIDMDINGFKHVEQYVKLRSRIDLPAAVETTVVVRDTAGNIVNTVFSPVNTAVEATAPDAIIKLYTSGTIGVPGTAALLESRNVKSNEEANFQAPDGVVISKNSEGTQLVTTSVKSNGTEYADIADTHVQLVDSADANLGSSTIVAGKSGQKIVAPDATVINSDTSFDKSVKSGEQLILTDVAVVITDQYGYELISENNKAAIDISKQIVVLNYNYTEAYINKMVELGLVLTESQKLAWHTFFINAQLGGYINDLSWLNVFYGSSLDVVRVNALNPNESLNYQNFEASDLDGDSIEPDGSTKYFGYGKSPAELFSSPHKYYWYALCKEPSTKVGGYLMGSYSLNVLPNSYQLMSPNVSSRIRFFGNILSLRSQDIGILTANNSMAISWENESLSKLYRNQITEETVTLTDTGVLSDQELLLFFWNNNGNPSSGVNGKWKCAALGENMTTAKHNLFDADLKTLLASL